MANTTFKGNVRAENGFTQFSTNGTTGAETSNTTIDSSGNTSIGGTLGVTGSLDVTGVTTLATVNGMTSFFNQGVGTTMLGLNPQWNQNFGKFGATGVVANIDDVLTEPITACLLYTSPSPRD